jgi:DNA-binding LacI/PurR family transcriptional regulator
VTAIPGQRRAVFLDRDGTVAEEVGYVNHASRVRLLPGSAGAVKRLRDAGFLAVIVTNQAGVAREAPSALHDGTVRGICSSMERLFASRERPTGLFVFQSSHFLTVLGWLQRRSLHVPRDVSVICRDDDPFLESVLPAPARYTLNSALFARKISRLVTAVVAGEIARPQQCRVLPRFVEGETLGTARE